MKYEVSFSEQHIMQNYESFFELKFLYISFYHQQIMLIWFNFGFYHIQKQLEYLQSGPKLLATQANFSVISPFPIF